MEFALVIYVPNDAVPGGLSFSACEKYKLRIVHDFPEMPVHIVFGDGFDDATPHIDPIINSWGSKFQELRFENSTFLLIPKNIWENPSNFDYAKDMEKIIILKKDKVKVDLQKMVYLIDFNPITPDELVTLITRMTNVHPGALNKV